MTVVDKAGGGGENGGGVSGGGRPGPGPVSNDALQKRYDALVLDKQQVHTHHTQLHLTFHVQLR